MLPRHLAVLRPEVDDRYVAHVRRTPEPASLLLGSPTAAAIVALLSLRPGEPFSISDLEVRTGSSYESVYRALQRLESARVIDVDRSRRQHTTVMREGPSTSALRALTLALGPLGSRLNWCRHLLGPASLEEAFVFGSIAAGTEQERSDIDLLVIGEVSTGTLLSHMGGLADLLARDINPVCRTREQLETGLAEGLSFLTSAWSGPRIWVLRRQQASAAAA